MKLNNLEVKILKDRELNDEPQASEAKELNNESPKLEVNEVNNLEVEVAEFQDVKPTPKDDKENKSEVENPSPKETKLKKGIPKKLMKKRVNIPLAVYVSQTLKLIKSKEEMDNKKPQVSN